MATTREHEHSHSRSEPEERDFYLPAASVSAALDSAEAFLTKHFSRHGVVLIPDSYNR
jgi:hypothetical protein